MISTEVAVLFLLFVIVYLSVDGAVITVPPVSVTVPPFTTATFTCEGTGDILNWLVESALLTDSIKQQREITVNTTSVNNTIFSSVLTVNALPINDDLGIGCEIITISPFNRVVSNSILTIRGISSVEDLSFNFSSNNSLIIAWSPPVYFSNDIPIDSPVSYEIQVLIGDERSIEDTITTNTNIVKVHNITQCDTFSVSVSAHVGQYTSSNETKENYGNCSIKVQEIFHKFDKATILFKIKCSPLLCNKIILVEASYDDNVYSESFQFFEGNLTEIDCISLNYSATYLLPFQHYQLSLKLLSLMMINEDQDIKYISTYNVQDVLVSTEGNGSVSVQCVFVSGSTADGCHVVFTDTNQESVESFDITGSDNTVLITLSANGVYNVTVYDIYNGSLYGPAVYYPTSVEAVIVTIPDLTPSITLASSTNDRWPNDQITVSSPAISVHATAFSPESSRVQLLLLPIICSAVGAVTIVILVIVLITIVALCMRQRKRNVIEGLINNNPAYGQVAQVQNQNDSQRPYVKTDANPAYETLAIAEHNRRINIDYETVW